MCNSGGGGAVAQVLSNQLRDSSLPVSAFKESALQIMRCVMLGILLPYTLHIAEQAGRHFIACL